MPDKKEGEVQEEKVADEEVKEEPVVETKPEVKEETVAELRTRLAVEIATLKGELKAQREMGRSAPPQVQQPRFVTSAELAGYSEAQKKDLEDKHGRPFDDICRQVDAFERQQDRERSSATEARLLVNEKVDEMIQADPQVSKLRSGIREYMDDVSIQDKMNPDKLQKHLERAVTYAKGKIGFAPVTKKQVIKQVREQGPSGDEGGGGDEDLREGEVKYGKHDLKAGEDTLRLDIQPLLDPAKRKKMKHDTDPNGVQIPIGFDEPPKFR